MNHVTMKSENVFDTPLVFNDTLETSNIRNILLIDSLVSESQLFFDSANSNTFPIIYSYNSNRNDFSQLLDKKFSNLNLERISFVFHDNILNGKTFLNQELLFLETDISDDASTFSPNTQLLLDTIQKMDVKHIDFLACNSLNYSNWKGFYAMLTKQTNVIVGASNDKTGNLNYGGDWIMENTNENIVNTYFNSNIEEYVSTLAITISQNGGTIYIDQSGNIIRYQSNSTSGSWTTISSWPVTFVNSNPISGNILTISLFTNITISSTTVGTGTNGYFSTGSNYITYDGSNYTVTIDGVTSYPGLIRNGTSSTNGYHTITVQNIKSAMINSSTLGSSAAWICQSYFGKNIKNAVGYNAVTNLITINNCSNSGTIASTSFTGFICGKYFGYNANADITNCFNTGTNSGAAGTGGIVGPNLADSSGTVTISNCYNTNAFGSGGGGIASQEAASNGGNVTITNCYNTGAIGGSSGQGGGIVGYQAASNNGTITISNCYNTGAISATPGGGGGIAGSQFGYNTNNTCTITNCYNLGAISTTSTTVGGGGICGKQAGNNTSATYTPTIVISNCYNLGTIAAFCSGILGGQESTNSNIPSITITNCYSAYTSNAGSAITSMVESIPNNWPTPTQNNCYSTLQSAWNDGTANSSLTDYPTTLYSNNPGTTWTTVALNTPYVLSSFNSQIYSPNTVTTAGVNYTSSAGLFSGSSYSLISVNNDSVPSNVTISLTTGVLTVINNFTTNTYLEKVFVYKGTSPNYNTYNFNTFSLTLDLTNNIISQNGGTIYIDKSGNNIRYQSNSTSGSWTTISSWPVIFTNSNPVSGNILTISLFTNITISSTTVGTGTNGYFITGSNYITYNGTNKIVTIDGVTVGYLGFINNGASTINGYSNITVTNIKIAILNSSRLITTAPYGGWLCQSYFGKGSSNITINNCSNSGTTTGSSNSGCICGAYFGYNGTATITQCFNTGSVTFGSTGGIFGSNLADTGGNVTISNCYNTGNVGSNSGGICGLSAGSSNGTVNISNCYNSGNISGSGGGGGIAGYLFGTNTNQTCSISNCYNTGNISTSSSTTSGPGGICGRGSGYNSLTITYNPIIQITNCYNVGTIDASSNGILGGNGSAVPNNKPTINITNCYTLYTGSGTAITSMTAIYATITQTTCGNSSSWVDTTVNLYLTGTPTSLYVNNPGATWVTLASNTPYRLSSLNSISGISQTAGTTLGNTLVTIFGNSLAGTTSVTFGANPATNITVVNDTTITCKTPANSVGNVDVVVTRTNIGASNPIYFTYVEYPTIYMTGGSFKGTLLTFN